MPFSSPYGNGPGALPSPVPNNMTLAGLQQSAAIQPQGSMPQMRMPAAAPNPAPSSNPPEGDGMSPEERSALSQLDGMSPEERSALNSVQSSDVQGPPETMLGGKLRKTAAGSFEVLRKGKWSPMTETETSIFNKIADGLGSAKNLLMGDAPRIAGAIGGEALGGTVGAGLGASAAGALSDVVQELAGIKDENHRSRLTTAVQDALAGIAGSVAPKAIGSGLESAAARYGTKMEANTAIRAGGQAIAQGDQAAGQDAQTLGIQLPNVPRGTSQQGVNQIQLDTRMKLIAARDKLVGDLKAPLQNLVDSGKSPASIKDLLENYQNSMDAGLYGPRQKAFDTARNQTFDFSVPMSKMREVIGGQLRENIFLQNGQVNIQKLNQVRDRLGGLPETVKPFLSEYFKLEGKTMGSPGGFSESGGQVPVSSAYSPPGSPHGDIVYSAEPTPAGQLSTTSMTGRGESPQDMESSYRPPAPASGSYEQGAGTEAPIASSQMPSNPAGARRSGLTLPEIDSLRKDYQRNANFQKAGDRTDVEKGWAQIAHEARLTEDGHMENVLGPVDPDAATKLRAWKDIYTRDHDGLMDFQKMVSHDPENAAASLIDPKNPDQARKLVAMLSANDRRYLAGGLLDHITQGMNGEMGTLNADQIKSNWDNIDPGVKHAIFGDPEVYPKINALMNLAKRINNTPDVSPRDSKPVREFLTTLMSAAIGGSLGGPSGATIGAARGGAKFIMSLFKNNPEARDYIMGKSADILMPKEGQYGTRKMLAEKAARAVQSDTAAIAGQAAARIPFHVGADRTNAEPATLGDFNGQ